MDGKQQENGSHPQFFVGHQPHKHQVPEHDRDLVNLQQHVYREAQLADVLQPALVGL